MNDKRDEAQGRRAAFTNRKITVVASIAAISAMLIGVWYFLALKQNTTMGTANSETRERQVLYWTDPMVPGFKSDKPGKSPLMDTQLVPVYANEAGTTTVSVRPEIMQSLGVGAPPPRGRGRAGGPPATPHPASC